MGKIRQAWAVLGLATALAGPLQARAQTPAYSSTNPAGALPAQPAPAAPLQVPDAEQASPAAPVDSARFVLSQITFRGAHALSPAALDKVWRPYAGKSVTLRDLRRICSATEAAYEAAGFPFVAVVTPPQTVRDGRVELLVVEARISDLTVLGLDPVARRQVAAAFQPIVGKSPLAARAVQLAYANAQAVPGLSVAGVLRAGSQTGGMDLVVQARRRVWRGYVNVNNYYSDPVGPWGVLAGADYYGESLYGDRTTVQLYAALNRDAQQVVRLAHYRGLAADGLSMSADLLVAKAHPRGALAPLDLATDVTSGHVELDRPLIVASGFALQGALSLEATDQKTQVFSSIGLSQDRLRIGVVRLTGSFNRPGVAGTFSTELRQGLNFAGASRRGDADLSRLDADPQATVFRASVQGEARLPFKSTLWATVQGQAAHRSLAAPEEFSVGNLTIGRGYDPGAAFGDSALAVSAEWRVKPYAPRPGLVVQPFVFADGVEIWNKEAGAPNRRWLSSAGVGAHVTLIGKAQLDVTYAVPSRAPLGLGEPKPQPTLLVNLTVGIPDAFAGVARMLHSGTSRQ